MVTPLAPIAARFAPMRCAAIRRWRSSWKAAFCCAICELRSYSAAL